MRTMALIAVLCLPGWAAAADPPPPAASPAPGAKPAPSAPNTENGRFAMTPTGDGFLRLDTRNGGVSYCSVSGAAARCRSSADERAAMEAEIARLMNENAKLRAAAPTAGPQTSSAPPLSNLPRDADVDRALGLFDKVFRAMVRIMREADTEAN